MIRYRMFVLLLLISWTTVYCSSPQTNNNNNNNDNNTNNNTTQSICQSDKDCSASRQVCRTSSGKCVDCLLAADCPKNHTCRRYKCIKDISCVTSKDCPQDTVCNGAENKCVECVSQNDCKDTLICQVGVCVPQPEPCNSDKDCKSLGQVCNSGKNRCADCLRDDDCPSYAFCKDNLCLEDVCKAGQVDCADPPRKRTICQENGGGWTSHTPCLQNEYCEAGNCKPLTCTPGQKKCELGGVSTCNSDGKAFGKPTPCPADKYCDSGECKALTCKPNEKKCKDRNTVEVCKSDRKGWDAQPCKTNQFCEQGECKDGACKPDEKACVNDTTVQVCLKDGSGWDKKNCQSDEVCEVGECKKKICTPSEISCADPKTVQTCGSKGLQWSKTPCNNGESCINGKCLKSLGSQQNPAQSCKAILDANASRGDGVYWLKAAVVYQVYCDMKTDNGGWTLLMQSQANDNTFKYSSIYWTTKNVLNQSNLNPGTGTSKYESYNSLTSREFMLNLANDRANRSLYTHSAPILPIDLFSMTANKKEPDNQNIKLKDWIVTSTKCTAITRAGRVGAVFTDKIYTRWAVNWFATQDVGYSLIGLGLKSEWFKGTTCNGEWGSKNNVLLWGR